MGLGLGLGLGSPSAPSISRAVSLRFVRKHIVCARGRGAWGMCVGYVRGVDAWGRCVGYVHRDGRGWAGMAVDDCAGVPTLEAERVWCAHSVCICTWCHRRTFEAEWAAERVRKSVQHSTWVE